MSAHGDESASRVSTEQLAARLQQLGFTIVPHGTHIGVRGSLFTSVQVRIDRGMLTMEPRFGPLARTTATVLKTLGMSALAVIALFPAREFDGALLVMFGALAMWGYDGVRYTLTESCIAQVRQAYTTLLAQVEGGPVASTTMAALGAAPLSVGAQAPSATRAEIRG